MSWLSFSVYGQLKPEDVFYTGEHFDQEKCWVRTYPDWGYLVLLNNDRFYSMNFAVKDHAIDRDTSELLGSYKVLNDTLYLTSIRFAKELFNWVHQDTLSMDTLKGFEWMNKEFADIKFRITKCENGQILLIGFGKNKLWYAIKDETGSRFVQRMKEDGQWKYLTR